jgi:hypothetical protein
VNAPPDFPASATAAGPTLAPEELAGHKLLALFDRAAARDFADVYVLASRFGKGVLLARAAQIDAVFDTGSWPACSTRQLRRAAPTAGSDRRATGWLKRLVPAPWVRALCAPRWSPEGSVLGVRVGSRDQRNGLLTRTPA